MKKPFIFFILKLFLLVVGGGLFIKITLTLYKVSDVDISPEMVTVLASLLGATVGGVITYLTTMGSILKTNRIKAALINKKTIYEPLYIEFKQLLKDIEEKEVIRISRDSQYRVIGSTSLEFWTRVKNDARIFQVPEYLKEDIVGMENNLNQYLNQIEELKDKSLEQLEILLNIKGYQINDNKNGIRSFFSAEKIIKKEVNILRDDFFTHGVLGIPEMSDEDKLTINAAFNEYIENNSELNSYNFYRVSLLKSLKDSLGLIELIIRTITNEYERKNNLF